MRTATYALLAGVMTVGAFARAHGQQALRVSAVRRDTIIAATTVTAAFTIANPGASPAKIALKVETPPDWTLLVGTAPDSVAANSSEIVMLSVVVPSRAAAGVYRLRAFVGDSSDWVAVAVAPRRAVEVTLLDRPGYVVSGKGYDASFTVRNRGNLGASFRVTARSTLGAATLDSSAIRLDAEQSRVVRVRVQTLADLSAAADDVLEVSATILDSSRAVTTASSRITVVPEPSRTIEEFLRLPVQVNLRARSSDAVSPFEIYGRGQLRDGGSTETEFLFRGPTGPFSAFGERDEYRLQLIASSWRMRAGDHVYMLSPLTGGAQPGFGLGLEGTRGLLSGGAYGQEFRRVPQKGTEAGGFLNVRIRPDVLVGVNAVTRQNGLLPGDVGSVLASFDRDRLDASLELARSQGNAGAGLARSARVSGSVAEYTYDVGHQYADTVFSGAQRGAGHSYLAATAQYVEWLSLSLNAGSHRVDLSRSTGVPYVETLDVGTLGATLFGRYTTEFGALRRTSRVSALSDVGTQRSVRFRGDHETPIGSISLESELGQVGLASGSGWYNDVSVSSRRAIAAGSAALWIERYSGGSITRGTEGTFTVGGDATLRLSGSIDATLMGYATRIKTGGAPWHSQLDAMVTHLLRNGNRVSLRARLIGGVTLAASDQSVAYLEYGIPLRLPVSRLRTPGRVRGRVIDATSGRGVSGALVRLGPQVAITDRNGSVAFGGVPGGEHRLSMSQETSFADAVFVGDPTLRVDSLREQPTTFRLAIAQSARVDIDVRRFTTARVAMAGTADSLAEAGPVANATLVLASDRDTLYRTTRDDGRVSFTDVPPGKWEITIRGDAPAFHRFDPDRVELTLAPGEKRELSFRLVPRRREIQVIGDEQELKNEAAEPKAQQQSTPSTRIRRPDDTRPETRRPESKSR